MAIQAVICDLGGVLLLLDRAALHQAQQKEAVPHQDYEELNGELVHFLGTLRPQYKVATICNGGSREAVNRKFGLGELVDLMIFDNEEGVSKPDPRIYLLTLDRLAICPQTAIFVDNKQENVAAARALGMVAIQFQNTPQTISAIQIALNHAPESNAQLFI